MIAQVPPKMRTVASSISTLFYNGLGFLPAPSVYALVYQAQGSGVNRSGMVAIQVCGVIGLLFLIPAICYQRMKDARDVENFAIQKSETFNQSSQQLARVEPINLPVDLVNIPPPTLCSPTSIRS